MNVWFFGVAAGQSAGHFLHAGEGAFTSVESANFLPEPLRCPDALLCPDREGGQAEGLAKMHLIGDWTAMGFWDRSADRRPGCNANFMVEGHVAFEVLKQLAQEQYPRLFERFPFEVVLHGLDVDELSAVDLCARCWTLVRCEELGPVVEIRHGVRGRTCLALIACAQRRRRASGRCWV